MGTSSSGTGPKGRTPLLPNWATGGDLMPDVNQDLIQDRTDGGEEETTPNEEISDPTTNETGNNQTDKDPNANHTHSLGTAKGAVKRWVNGGRSASLQKAAREYVRKTGGHRNATLSASAGIRAGSNYLGFWGGVADSGLVQTLQDFGLADCIGKSTEEVCARIADKIAPAGTTNDEAIARTALMMAFDRLCEKLIENGQDISTLDRLDETMLRETIVEFVSAYIFQKWVYEACQALERNDISEADVVAKEGEMREFITEEVKSSLVDMDVQKLDLSEGEGKQIIEEIFDLAYSTLEK